MATFLDRLGLGRPELRAWAMYDWANSAYQTIIAAVFPIYFRRVVAADLPEKDALSLFASASTLAILVVAIVAPLLGAIADHAAVKKRLSLFASMIPRHKSSEFFAFFGVFERYAGVLGPAVFALVVSLSGHGRIAILAVLIFFIVGTLLLTGVDVDAGRREARFGEREMAAMH